MTYCEAWMQAELQWTEPFQKLRLRLWRKMLLKVLGVFLLGAAAVFGAMCPAGLSDALGWSLLFLLLGLLVTGLLTAFMPSQAGRRFFVKRLRKSIRHLSAKQQEELGRDLLGAMGDSRRTFSFTDDSYGQNHAPCRFLMGRRWVFLTNGWDYTPMVVSLKGVASFRAKDDAVAVGGNVIRYNSIFFEGTSGVLRFHDMRHRDRALAMLLTQKASYA